MNIQNTLNTVTRTARRGLLVTKKYSPQILTAVGVVSGVTSTVLAAKATLKLEPIIEELEVGLDLVSDKSKEVDGRGRLLHSDKELAKDRFFVYGRTTLQLAKLYGPAVSAGVVSIACVVSAQGIMQKREASVTAAYVALERGFNEYRKRVQDALGVEEERNLRYAITEDRHDDTKKGKSEVVKNVGPHGESVYARFFDPLSSSWQNNAEYNLYFLSAQQDHFNNMLRARGHVFLNEVYDALGIPRSQAGQVVGWVFTKDGSTDNFIDFGLHRDTPKVREFVNGVEAAVLLDFNVDGLIYDKI